MKKLTPNASSSSNSNSTNLAAYHVKVIMFKLFIISLLCNVSCFTLKPISELNCLLNRITVLFSN